MFFTPIKLIVSTITLVILAFIINIFLAIVFQLDPIYLAIPTAVFFVLWFLFFTIQIISFYLSPQALFQSSFAGIGDVQTKLLPTQEIYTGQVGDINFKCEIFKGRDRTNGYLYFDKTTNFQIAVAKAKPTQLPSSLKKISNNNYEDKIIYSDRSNQSEIFLNNPKNIEYINFLIKQYNVEIYVLHNQIKIRLTNLDSPQKLRQIFDLSSRLI